MPRGIVDLDEYGPKYFEMLAGRRGSPEYAWLSRHVWGIDIVDLGCGTKNFRPLRTTRADGITRVDLFSGHEDVTADLAELPFEDYSFEESVLCHVLGHVESPDAVLQEAARVSRACVHVLTPYRPFVSRANFWNRALGRPYTPDPTVKRVYNKPELLFLMENAGIRVDAMAIYKRWYLYAQGWAGLPIGRGQGPNQRIYT